MADRIIGARAIEITGGGFGQATSPTSAHGPRSPLYFWTDDVLLCGRHANGMRLQPFTNADREAGYGTLGCPFCHGGALAGTHSRYPSQKKLIETLDAYTSVATQQMKMYRVFVYHAHAPSREQHILLGCFPSCESAQGYIDTVQAPCSEGCSLYLLTPYTQRADKEEYV